MQYHAPHFFAHSQPRPRFCIFRPGGTLAPLIPADELPSWLHICSWGSETVMDLQPVSLSYIPREGEYDVICHHCSSSVDSLHQSASDKNDDSPQSIKSCPGVFVKPMPDSESALAAPRAFSGVPWPVFGQPHFYPGVANPYLGYYMVGVPGMSTNPVTAPADMYKALGVMRTGSSDENSMPPGLQDPFQIPGPPRVDTSAASIGPTNDPMSCMSVPPEPNLEERNHAQGLPSLGSSEMELAAAIAASLCSVSRVNGSVASTRSLTAAVERLKQRQNKPVSRGASIHRSTILEAERKPPSRASSRGSRVHKVRSARRRRARLPRRRRRKLPEPQASSDVAEKAKLENAKPETLEPEEPESAEPTSEQVNSSTKRRERREKMARGRKDRYSKGGHWQQMAPKWSRAVPHR